VPFSNPLKDTEEGLRGFEITDPRWLRALLRVQCLPADELKTRLPVAAESPTKPRETQ
jgi:hypothetical protein